MPTTVEKKLVICPCPTENANKHVQICGIDICVAPNMHILSLLCDGRGTGHGVLLFELPFVTTS